jgi:hypothetical protein
MTIAIELPGDMRRVTVLLQSHPQWRYHTYDVNGCIVFAVDTKGEST